LKGPERKPLQASEGLSDLDLGSGLPGRAVRPLTNALVRIMSGRSARPGNPDEAKGGRRDPVLALPRLGGSIPPGPSTVAPGPHDLLAPPASWRFKHFSVELRV